MITSIKTKIDLSKHVIGHTVEETDITTNKDTIKVHIPAIMSKIKKDTPTIKNVSLGNSRTIFINDQTCMPKFSSIIKEKNYIEVKKENNSSLNSLTKTHNNKIVIPKDVAVQCTFNHGKISKKTFNSNLSL